MPDDQATDARQSAPFGYDEKRSSQQGEHRRGGGLDLCARIGRQIGVASLIAFVGGSLLAAITADGAAQASQPAAQQVGRCGALSGIALKDGKVDKAIMLAGGDLVNVDAGQPGLPA